jgi:hypothetical protein
MNQKFKAAFSLEANFKQGVLLGFILSFGLIFLIYKPYNTFLELVFQILIGVGFIGIVLNILMMLITSTLLSVFSFFSKTLAAKFRKEQLFNLLMFSHLPLLLGIIIGIFRLFYFNINSIPILVFLEIVSVLFFIYNIKKQITN